MKRYECILWVLGAVLMITIPSNAQNSKCKCSDCKDSSCSCCPSQIFSGTLQKEGNTYKFLEDSGKEWKIENPEELSHHESGHVKLSGHVYSNDVIKVTAVKPSKDDAVNDEMKEKKEHKE